MQGGALLCVACVRSSTLDMHMRIIVINNNKLDVMLEFVQAEAAEGFLHEIYVYSCQQINKKVSQNWQYAKLFIHAQCGRSTLSEK